MTVKELIDLLQQYPPYLEVAVTYESVVKNLNSTNLYVSADGVLLLDADGNFYRDDFEKGRLPATSHHD